MSNQPAILFFDVDGTLVGFNGAAGSDKDAHNINPTPAVYDAFKRLRENGHLPLICSGRPQWLIPKTIRDLDTVGFVLNGGGALEIDGELVFEERIDVALVRELAERVLAADAFACFEGNLGSVNLYREGKEVEAFPNAMTRYSVDELLAEDMPVYCKILLRWEYFEGVNAGSTFIEDNFYVCDTGAGRRELTPKGVDKGLGVRRALEYFGFEGNERSFGFGDSGNDIGMLEAVEMPVAMGNAMPEVKAISCYITDGVADDGVVTALEHFGLI